LTSSNEREAPDQSTDQSAVILQFQPASESFSQSAGETLKRSA
jgi:hypothetical protein